jgi:hypothetical protein
VLAPRADRVQYVIMNLGMSRAWPSSVPGVCVLTMSLPAASFQEQDYKHMVFPARMYIDYVRIYQREGASPDALSCDPKSHPTADYINSCVPWLGSASGGGCSRPRAQAHERVHKREPDALEGRELYIPAQLALQRLLLTAPAAARASVPGRPRRAALARITLRARHAYVSIAPGLSARSIYGPRMCIL